MHLLELNNIGKIYASEGAISVGIRGVNLTFDIGEFVAITGQSGSGKSTLLNVISGMDSYEEGELLIEGETTSFYENEDWELYREKYISFIFQDYNIIDSFTVLENVELALLSIENPKERRARAKELIERVGLTDFMNHKGSHLSGGQKQRTVIARALAKDSPIILADEPTGNLDYQTSMEIIELLKEVSKDKLLIMVTHNFDEVKDYATREIRVYDGAIKSDNVLREVEASEKIADIKPKTIVGNSTKSIRDGFKIGWTIFKSKPRLSLFLCVLLSIAGLSLFVSGGAIGKGIKYNIFSQRNMFIKQDGRVVVIRRDGKAISEEEVKQLANDYDAKDYLQCDNLLDGVSYDEWYEYETYDSVESYNETPLIVDNKNVGEADYGRYPQEINECLIYVPYSLKNTFTTKSVDDKDTISRYGVSFTITGVKYYTDNRNIGKIIVTDEAYKIESCLKYMSVTNNIEIVTDKDGKEVTDKDIADANVKVEYSLDCPKDRAVVTVPENLIDYFNENTDSLAFNVTLNQAIDTNEYLYGIYGTGYDESDEDTALKLTHMIKFSDCDISSKSNTSTVRVKVNPLMLVDDIDKIIDENYTKCSLFYSSESKAKKAAQKINEDSDKEYLALNSDEEYTPDALVYLEQYLAGAFYLFFLVILIFFMSMVVNLCTRKSIGAFKNDIGIMRSMGIKVRTIKIAVFMRMLISTIAPIIVVFIFAFFAYRNYYMNVILLYLAPGYYVLIYLGLLWITVRATKKQIKRLFGTTVKKSLKKGAE